MPTVDMDKFKDNVLLVIHAQTLMKELLFTPLSSIYLKGFAMGAFVGFSVKPDVAVSVARVAHALLRVYLIDDSLERRSGKASYAVLQSHLRYW